MFVYLCFSLCVSVLQEWLDLRCRGVRNANAYILVYDICCVESFEYVKMIRQQIVEHRYGRPQLARQSLNTQPLTPSLLTLPGYF